MRRLIVYAGLATTIWLAGFTAASTVIGQSAQAAFPSGAKIAFVDALRIARQSTEGQAAAAQLKALSDKRVAELNEQGKQLNARLQELQQNQGGPADAARTKLRTDIEQNQNDLLKARRNAEIEMADLEQRLLSDFTRRLGPVIRDVANERQLHVVLPVRSDFLWAHPGLDITDQVLAKFNAAR